MTVNGSSVVDAVKEVSILRATLLKCLACHLCDSLLRDATTISECLHSFCRDCITAKLNDGETETCPVCEVHLGPLPLEKLRPDHHLDVLKEKLSSKKRKLVASSNGNGTRRK
jgi:E3 ubiquitin-protein ligase DRIP